MFRYSIRIDENSDVDVIVALLAQKLAESDISDGLTVDIVGQIRSILFDADSHGETMIGLGANYAVTRSISGDGYTIKINAQYGGKPGFMSRVFRSLFER